jgi:hypothetical protein
MIRRTLPTLLLFALIAGPSWAQSAATSEASQTQKASDEPPQFISRINGLFNGDLPQLDLPGTYKLILRPHFGDLVRRDYMRFDAGLRWALNDNFELTSEASAYFTHGLGGSSADGYGIGRIRLGSKYIFERWPLRGYETSFTINAEIPTGHPPIDMTDGNYHFAPTVVVQHDWTSRPRLTTFGGIGLDIVGRSKVAGTYGTNEPHDHSVSFTAGAIYDLGQIKWTLTGTYATTAGITRHAENFYYFQPGMLWYVPSRFTFHSRTQWIVGLSASTSYGPDGFDFSLSSRLRAEITFRQFMDKIHVRSKPSP